MTDLQKQLDTRHCSKCKQLKLTDNFNKDNARKDGLCLLCKECGKKIRAKFYRTLRGRYSSYKSDAKRRKIEFNLSSKEFKTFWKKSCHYCENEIEFIGLDRVDNTAGYQLNNIVSCCSTCNNMKKNLSSSVFLEHCHKISQHQRKETNETND